MALEVSSFEGHLMVSGEPGGPFDGLGGAGRINVLGVAPCRDSFVSAY